jgi:HPt (histidine-containing phosphotransfer) domain-containing protein
VVDLSPLTEAFGGLTEDAVALLDQFFISAMDDIGWVHDALARKDFQVARKTIHHAGGGAKGVGAVEFAAICATIERSLAEGDEPGVEQLASQLAPALTRARQEFAALRT